MGNQSKTLSAPVLTSTTNNNLGTVCYLPWIRMNLNRQGEFWTVKELNPPKRPDVKYGVYRITNSKSIYRSLGLDSTVSGGVGPFSMSASVSSLNEYTYNTHSANFLLNSVHLQSLDTNTHSVNPTDAFKERLNRINSEQDALEFLKSVGTGVVIGVKRGVVFSCAISINATNTETKSKLDTELGAEYGTIASFSLALSKLDKEALSMIEISVTISQQGGTPACVPTIPAFTGDVTKETIDAYLAEAQESCNEYITGDLKEQIKNLPSSGDYAIVHSEYNTTSALAGGLLDGHKKKAEIIQWLENAYRTFETKANLIDKRLDTLAHFLEGGNKNGIVTKALEHLDGNFINGPGGYRALGSVEDFKAPLRNALVNAKKIPGIITSMTRDSTDILTKVNYYDAKIKALMSDDVDRAISLLDQIYFKYWAETKDQNLHWWVEGKTVSVNRSQKNTTVILSGAKLTDQALKDTTYQKFITRGDDFVKDVCYFMVGWYERDGFSAVPFVINAAFGFNHYYSLVVPNVGYNVTGATTGNQRTMNIGNVDFTINATSNKDWELKIDDGRR